MKAKISVFILAVVLTAIISYPVLFDGVIESKSEDFKSSIWTSSNTLKFEFDFEETDSININLFFRIDNNFDQFSNLILFCDLINGDLNDTISDTLNINIFDSWGKCLGSGPSEIKTFEHNFKENYTLNKGKYFLNILHGMRVDSLYGIKDFGFKITQ